MYGSFEELPNGIKESVNKERGRLKGHDFWAKLLWHLHANNGAAHLSQKWLMELLGYKDAERMGKYRQVLVRAGLLNVARYFAQGKASKLHSLTPKAKEMFLEQQSIAQARA
jgi:hypothetical protein